MKEKSFLCKGEWSFVTAWTVKGQINIPEGKTEINNFVPNKLEEKTETLLVITSFSVSHCFPGRVVRLTGAFLPANVFPYLKLAQNKFTPTAAVSVSTPHIYFREW